MKRQIQNELKRAFRNPVFYSVIALESILLVIYFIQEVYPVWTETVPFYKSQLHSGKVDFIPGAYYTWIGFHYSPLRSVLFGILPILAALPYGASLYTDEKIHYTNHIFIRSEKRNYYVAKLLVIILSGGVVSIFPFLLSFFMNILVLPMERINPATSYFSVRETEVMSGLFCRSPFIYLLCYIFIVFLGFGLMNGICFIAACCFENTIVVILTPFVVYYCTFVLKGFYKQLVVPWQYLRVNDMHVDELPVICVQALLLTAVLIVCVFYKSRKADAL